MSAYGALSDDAVGGKPLVVALAACHQGQTKAGVDSGWIALAGDVNLSGATFVDFRDQRKFGNPIKGAMILSRNIGCALDKAAKAANADDVPLLCLGGDHTVSVGTVAATKWRHPTTRLIWIDAHPDINTPDVRSPSVAGQRAPHPNVVPQTTMSGNCHGMPVAHLMNLVDGFQLPACIEPHEILYIGLRSIVRAHVCSQPGLRLTLSLAGRRRAGSTGGNQAGGRVRVLCGRNPGARDGRHPGRCRLEMGIAIGDGIRFPVAHIVGRRFDGPEICTGNRDPGARWPNATAGRHRSAVGEQSRLQGPMPSRYRRAEPGPIHRTWRCDNDSNDAGAPIRMDPISCSAATLKDPGFHSDGRRQSRYINGPTVKRGPAYTDD